MHKTKNNILIIIALLGLAASTYLTVHHFKILTQGFDGPSFCSMGEKFDCDIVNMSSFSKFGPFPVAGLGLVYFLYLTLTSLYARIVPESAKATLALPFLVLLPGLALVLYLAYISAFILKTWCIFCAALYLLTFISFGLLSSILEVKIIHIGSFMINYFKKAFGGNSKLSFAPRFLMHFAFAAVVMGLSLFILYANETKYASDFEDFDHQAYLNFFYAQKPIPMPDVKGRPLFGTEGAPVTIVEFSDFECPFCQKAAFNLKPRLKEFQKDIAFYYFAYPLDKSCNPYMKHDMHLNACNAAKAALCAQDQGKFWQYHDKLFENMPKYSADQLKGYAKLIGLNLSQFEACIASEAPKTKILADIEAAKGVGLQGTPLVILNGRILKDWYNPVVLKLLIQEELKKAKSK